MRADRLISLLMILQNRGRQTAQNLAEELEVTERTIYRDVIALNSSGIPVYTERGPGGGISLVESYRTNLTGLNPAEVRALFMFSIPAPMTELGINQELKAALLKLSAALPSTLRQAEGNVRQRIYIDSEWWHKNNEPVPHLQVIHKAIWDDRKLGVTRRFEFEVEIERILEPYGLVSKAGVWYLIWRHEDYYGVHRLSDIWNVELFDDGFERQADFDLVSYWKDWCKRYVDSNPGYLVSVKVSPDFIPYLPMVFGNSVRVEEDETVPVDDSGRKTLTLNFDSFWIARARILGYGSAIEVLSPIELRMSIADFAAQTVSLYGELTA